VDFNSILQTTLGTDYFYDFLNLGFKMTATSGEDMPYTGVLSASRVFAFCGTNQPFTPDLWFDAVKQGRTFVTTGPMLELQVEGALPGSEIQVATNRPVKVVARAWGLRGGSAPERIRLIQFGQVVCERVAENPEQSELKLETTLEAGHGFWLAAYAKGRDGSEAITTPVYVVRRGFRFWDVGQAGKLIERQLGVLSEIEAALAECEKVVKAGTAPLDYWTRWGAEQADQVRERISRAKADYGELSRTLEVEVNRRKAAP
jgi:hypothetical protein